MKFRKCETCTPAKEKGYRVSIPHECMACFHGNSPTGYEKPCDICMNVGNGTQCYFSNCSEESIQDLLLSSTAWEKLKWNLRNKRALESAARELVEIEKEYLSAGFVVRGK